MHVQHDEAFYILWGTEGNWFLLFSFSFYCIFLDSFLVFFCFLFSFILWFNGILRCFRWDFLRGKMFLMGNGGRQSFLFENVTDLFIFVCHFIDFCTLNFFYSVKLVTVTVVRLLSAACLKILEKFHEFMLQKVEIFK